MWELNHKEGWVLKNWCFWTVVLKKTLESPLDCKEMKPVNPKENQSWIFIGRTDAEAEAPILWPPDAKKWFLGKDSDVGKDWRQDEKGWQRIDGWMASPTQWTWVCTQRVGLNKVKLLNECESNEHGIISNGFSNLVFNISEKELFLYVWSRKTIKWPLFKNY